MSDSSETFSMSMASAWTALERDGETIVVTYTAYPGSLGSVKTSEQWPSHLGSMNYSSSAAMRGLIWALLFTSEGESPTRVNSTQLSHSGCWCNSSKKRDTSDGER